MSVNCEINVKAKELGKDEIQLEMSYKQDDYEEILMYYCEITNKKLMYLCENKISLFELNELFESNVLREILDEPRGIHLYINGDNIIDFESKIDLNINGNLMMDLNVRFYEVHDMIFDQETSRFVATEETFILTTIDNGDDIVGIDAIYEDKESLTKDILDNKFKLHSSLNSNFDNIVNKFTMDTISGEEYVLEKRELLTRKEVK